jgi:hypothetical protein
MLCRWSYTVETDMWQYLGGSIDINANSRPPLSFYSEKGMSAAANWPYPRQSAVGATGLDGRLYMFGGE